MNTHETVHNSYRRAGKERRGGEFGLLGVHFSAVWPVANHTCFFVV